MAHGLAPGDVLPGHVAVKVAYSGCASPEALFAVGVRVASGAEALALAVQREQAAWGASQGDGPGDGGQVVGPVESPADGAAVITAAAPMAFPPGIFRPARAWGFAVYKPLKGGAKPPWEVSWERFGRGEHPDAIAVMQGDGKKPVTGATVRKHLLTSVLHGRGLDLARLAAAEPKPAGAAPRGLSGLLTRGDWTALEEAEAAAGLDLVGREEDGRRRKDLLRAALGAAVDEDPKSDAQRATEAAWYGKIDWWFHLKASGFTPPS